MILADSAVLDALYPYVGRAVNVLNWWSSRPGKAAAALLAALQKDDAFEHRAVWQSGQNHALAVFRKGARDELAAIAQFLADEPISKRRK